MELVYIWVRSYRCFQNTGFNFSNRFKITYDGFGLIIDEELKNPPNFFGNKVKNIIGIVGENGSGKSSILELVSTNQKERRIEMDNHFFVYFDNSSSKFYIEFYQGDNDLMLKKYEKFKFFSDSIGYLTLDIKGNGLTKENFLKEKTNNKLKICRIKSKMTKRSYQSNNKLSRKINFKYSDIDKLDLFEMLKELEQLKVFEGLKKGQTDEAIVTIKDINSFRKYNFSKNIFRERLGDFESYIVYIVVIKFSKYILKEEIKMYSSKNYNNLDYNSKILEELINFLHRLDFSSNRLLEEREKFRDRFNYNIDKEEFLKIVEKLFEETLVENLLYRDCSLRRVVGEVRELLINNTKINRKGMRDLEDLIGAIEDIKLILNSSTNEWKNIHRLVLKSKSEGFQLLQILKNNLYLKDVLSVEIESFSDGEETVLSFFYILKKAILEGEEKQILLLLDEVELYFHPEWCRTFIYRLIEYLEKNTYDKSIYIILSTHSPFILSDIPKVNLRLLENTRGITELREPEQETFASGIYKLLKNEFFLKKYMGQFSEKKVKDTLLLISDLKSEKDEEKISEIRKRILIIGDDLIRESLNKNLESKLLSVGSRKKNNLSLFESLYEELNEKEKDELIKRLKNR